MLGVKSHASWLSPLTYLLSMIFSRCITLSQMAVFPLRSEQPSIVYVQHSLLGQSSVRGCSGCCHVLATVSNAAVDMKVHASLWREVFKISQKPLLSFGGSLKEVRYRLSFSLFFFQDTGRLMSFFCNRRKSSAISLATWTCFFHHYTIWRGGLCLH